MAQAESKKARIGIVCWWYNRGQATVGRYLRTIFDELGFATFVLARPSSDGRRGDGFIDTKDIWQQPDVTHASSSDIASDEYIDWATTHAIDILFFDQNYQFSEIQALRNRGIKTVGRFVWEQFDPSHVDGAKGAFDVIYSLTDVEQSRYRALGIESPRVRWGCHPELLTTRAQKRETLTYFYPAGYLSARKPTREVIDAFKKAAIADAELIIKCQTKHHRALWYHFAGQYKSGVRKAFSYLFHGLNRKKYLEEGFFAPNIKIIADDVCAEDYHALFASCHVCLAPTRWEGLGLHLYEACAFNMPVITNDYPPMNEVITNEDNGIAIESDLTDRAVSGIPACRTDVDLLADAIRRVSFDEYRHTLEAGMNMRARELSWDHTVSDYSALVEELLCGVSQPC